MSKVKRVSISKEEFYAKIKQNNKSLHIVIDIPNNISAELQEELEPLVDFFLKLKNKNDYKVVDL